MIHIVFNEADERVLREAMALDESFTGDIHLVRDDFAVGPIAGMYADEGRETRRRFWEEAAGAADPKHPFQWHDDHESMLALADTLRQDPEQQVWIWAAQNKHDVCGYYWTLYFMKEFKGRVFILYLNNLPFINEKGSLFYPTWLHEIPAREFLKARKLAREITSAEFEVDPDEWTKLCNENRGVRLLEGGKKIVQEDYNYYDSELRKYVMPDWQKAGRIIHNFQHKAKQSTGDVYLFWRLKLMRDEGKFDFQGNPDKPKELEIKNKAAAAAINE